MTINELNEQIKASGGNWVAAENEISQLPDRVFQGMLGSIVPPDYVLPQPSPEEKLTTEGLPSSIDWRNNYGNYVTSVKSQGKCGSCVGFGCTASVESAIAIEHKMLLDLSEADAFFCSSHGAACNGWNLSQYFPANQQRGVCEGALFPYDTAFPNNNPTCIINPLRPQNAFTYNKIHTITTLAGTKNYLATVGPIAAHMDVYSDFSKYSGGIYKRSPGATLKGGHCICIVGYNDAQGGYYICKNSWGPTWGGQMEGFFYIAYGQCRMDSVEKCAATQTVLPPLVLHNFKCLNNDVISTTNVYLNGNMATSSVNLVSSTDPSLNAGTYWETESLANGAIAFKCFGDAQANNFLYLNGNTTDDTVNLVSSTGFAGTQWMPETLPDGSTAYKCLDNSGNGANVYLNGMPGGTVSLVPQAGGQYMGAHWIEDGFLN